MSNPDFPMPPEGWQDAPMSPGDLTDPERELLADLTVLTLLPQMQQLRPEQSYTYERIADAVAGAAEDGMVTLVGNAFDVWVIIRGRPIVHAARDWLAWQALKFERAAASN
jgi:hypothetical protein